MLSFLLTSLIRYHKKSPISNKIKTLYHFEAEILTIEIKFYKGAKRLGGERESGRNDSGADGKVGETTRIHGDALKYLNLERQRNNVVSLQPVLHADPC